MMAVQSTRKYIKSSALSTIVTSICLIILIPTTIKKGVFRVNLSNCNFYSTYIGIENFDSKYDLNIFYPLKILCLIVLFLIIIYRIYFCSNWYIYAEYIYEDTCLKTMKIEVMLYQRSYRMVYYGIATIISSLIFLVSIYFEYNKFKQCLSDNNISTEELYNYEKSSIYLICCIIIDYLVEALYLRDFIINIIKDWSYIDYGMGNLTIWNQIFFFGIKFNYIMKYSYSAIVVAIILFYKFI